MKPFLSCFLNELILTKIPNLYTVDKLILPLKNGLKNNNEQQKETTQF